ncbi:MAG TPA: DUF3891 family protein [Solirubrobacteraceae bacterium]|nr:DUF3891 family protein [Solirubrobacteraceae bacterium]
MLISRRSDGLHAVTQQEHARLAGRLAELWGAERFPLGPTRDSLIIAAARHDDGWQTLDGAPCVNDAEGRPAHFLEVPLETTVGPYGEGVDAIYPDDRYAGVLASMHWAGLYSARFGLQEGGLLEHPLAREAAAAQDQRAAATASEIWQDSGGLRSELEAQRWRDYELLQALDLISLALCLIDTRTPTEGDTLPAATNLRSIDQPPGGRSVALVPAAGGGYSDLEIAVREPGVVEIEPFPFTTAGAEVEFSARRMPDQRFDDPAGAYADAEPLTIALTLVGA